MNTRNRGEPSFLKRFEPRAQIKSKQKRQQHGEISIAVGIHSQLRGIE